MQHALLMRCLDGAADGCQDSYRVRRLEPSFAMQNATKILAAHELHHEVRAPRGERAEVEDGDDARVLQPRDELRLAAEPAPRAVVLEQLGPDDFYRDLSIE